MSNLQEFIDYVWSFYNPQSDLYPIKGLTKKDILEASWLYLQMCCYPSMPEYSWGDGDSLDREHVRDCLLYTSPSPRDKRQSRMPSSA